MNTTKNLSLREIAGSKERESAPPAGTTIYAYDGDNVVEELDGGGTAVARYTQGLGIDEPLAMYRGGLSYYYNADGLGSITSLTNASGTIAATYTYGSFGKLTASTGTVTNPFRYTGREYGTDTGLYYYRARYYDSNAGRFISEDPAGYGAATNLYVYALNNPVNLIDPLGWSPVSDSYAKYVACRDNLRNKFYPGKRSAECVKKGAEEVQDIAAEANGEGKLPEPPTMRANFNLDNAYFEAFLEAATECLKEFPLAGLDRRFRDIDVAKTFEPAWDTKLEDIIDFFVK